MPEHEPSPHPPDGALPVRRVRKAYEQVYDQLREAILSGRYASGHRLPTEAQLATSFGVSRSTVREALRLLIAENLVRTAKGAGGGTFVTLPTLDHVSEYLQRSIELLSATDDVSLAEFLEARELIEVFAVRQAALRHTSSDLTALRSTLTAAGEDATPEQQYERNRRFHEVLVDACGNGLLKISAQPIFFVLHTHLRRFALGPDFPRSVCADHATIVDAIESGDADEAERRMRHHLADLSAVYAAIWHRSGDGGTAGPKSDI